MTLQISNRQARRLVLNLQGLAEDQHNKLTESRLHKIIQRLGFVQVDSIRWVHRAQHMILHSRNVGYRPEDLKRLIERRGKLFENYTHDASIIPCEYFQYWRHRFRRDEARIRKNYVGWQGDGFLSQCESIVQKIQTDGQLKSRDLSSENNAPGQMWQWNDSKTALEYLWRTGTLAIAARDGFEKVYDLTERTIPAKHFEAECSEEAFIDWCCRTAIERLGVCSPADIAGFWKSITIAEVRLWLKQNASATVSVAVEDCNGQSRRMLARDDIENQIATCESMPNQMRALSPFDPVCRDRKRLEWMFGFEYRIEIYVPAAKRKYGYYVFPLLDGEAFVGRIDMKADRESGRLTTANVWWEESTAPTKARQKRLAAELKRKAALCDVSVDG